MADTKLDLDINTFPRDPQKLIKGLRDIVTWGIQGGNVLREHESDLVLFAANAGLYGYQLLRLDDQPLFGASADDPVITSKDDAIRLLTAHLADAESRQPAAHAMAEGAAIAEENANLSPMVWIQIAQLAWQIIKIIRNK